MTRTITKGDQVKVLSNIIVSRAIQAREGQEFKVLNRKGSRLQISANVWVNVTDVMPLDENVLQA